MHKNLKYLQFPIAILLLFETFKALSQTVPTPVKPARAPTEKPPSDKTAWFKNARYGMFIHWGLYAQIGYNEWAMDRFHIQKTDYEKLAKTFNPTKYNPDAWVSLAKAAGMKYIVFVSKHHDGFSMYNTKLSNYSIMNTPYRRDVLGMLAAACQRQKMPLGVYYSIPDWMHPNYLPRRYWEYPKVSNANPELYRNYLTGQLMELATQYKPALFWFDGDWDKVIDSVQATAITTKLQEKLPNVLINNRLFNRNSTIGDFFTPENEIPARGLVNKKGEPALFEVCHTFDVNQAWGYDPYMNSFMSSRELIRNLIDIASKGGNLLMNVGPTPEGEIQDEFKIRLSAGGKWLAKYGESIYGTTAGIFERLPFFGRSTTKGSTLYFHVFLFPSDGVLRIPMLENNIKYVKLLGPKGKPLTYTLQNNQILISLPEQSPETDAAVIKMEVEGIPKVKSYTPNYTAADTAIEFAAPYAELYPRAEVGKNGTANAFNLVQYYKKVMLEDWKSKDQYPEWTFTLSDAGEYKIKVYAACVKRNPAPTFAVDLDGKAVENSILETKSYAAPDLLSLGKVNISAGQHAISIRPMAIPGTRVMKIEKIVLVKTK